MPAFYVGIHCLLLVVGAAAAVLAGLPPEANATLVKNATAEARARAGTTLVVPCAVPVDGGPVTLVRWLVPDGTGGELACSAYLPATDTDPSCAQLDRLGISLVQGDPVATRLRIERVTQASEGWYKCRVFSHSRLFVGFTRLFVEDKPSAPGNWTLTPLNSTSLRADWLPPDSHGNLPVLLYELLGPGLRLNITGGQQSVVIERLKPYTEYCLSVGAINAVGRGPASAAKCSRTLAGLPVQGALQVRLAGAAAVWDTGAALEISLRRELLFGTVQGVELRYLLVRHLETRNSPYAGQVVSNKVSGSQLFSRGDTANYTLSGLKPYSRYNLTYCVDNEAGFGPAGHVEFDTAQGFAPPPNLMVDRESIFDTNLTVSWSLPGRANGRLLGYRLDVYLQGSGGSEPVDTWNTGPADSKWSVTGLKPYTSYALRLSAVTGRGRGPDSNPYPVLTDPGAPAPPTNLSADPGYLAGLLVSWDNRPSCFGGGFCGLDFPSHLLTYRVHWLVAGSAPDHWDAGRTADRLSQCNCNSSWLPVQQKPCHPRPDRICELVPWRALLRSTDPSRLGKSSGNAPPLSAASAAPLRAEVTVLSVGVSQYDTNRRYLGSRSEPAVVSVPASVLMFSAEEGSGSGGPSDKKRWSPESGPVDALDRTIIAGIAVGCIIVLLAVSVIIVLGWKWVCSHRGYQRPFGQGVETIEFFDQEQPHSNSSSNSRPQLKLYSQTEHKAMSLAEFRDHVIASHENDNSAYQVEFEEVQRATHKDWPSAHAKHAENLSKNRYTDICPYDHSRVVLHSNAGKKMGDYINANYVDGYRRDKAYIACQGPVPSTFDDFWLMVWENHCSVIIMISNFVERGRRKCDQYWPANGSETYGAIAVKLVRQLNKASYCLRVFTIRNCRAKNLVKERTVYHFHYSEWPDYGVPAYPLPVLNFVQRTASYWTKQSGPVIVHCSAGVGRTGTFICIESQIRQILCEKTVNVRGFLEHIRQQRMRLVQTEEQYIFIHDVLLEFLLCPEREIPRERLPVYVNSLMETEPCGCSRLETQYQLCVAHNPAQFELLSAWKSCNVSKNRSDVYPIESRRVKLTSEPGVEGSDYINASHLHGYFSVSEFIVTQHPTEGTMFDFYKMIWDQNCVCVVCVQPDSPELEPEAAAASDEARQQQPQPQIWPQSEAETNSAGYLQVWFRSSEDLPFAVRREFLLASKQDDYSVLTNVWTLKRWPATLGQSSDLIKLVKAVADSRWSTMSPIIVMDLYGGSYAGIFCSLYVLYHQLMMEGAADAYSLFKMYHLQRPYIFNSKADLEFIYEVIGYHAKHCSPSNSLSLRRSNHHGNGSLTTQRSHDSQATAAAASSQSPAPETLPLRILGGAGCAASASTAADAADAADDAPPMLRFANGDHSSAAAAAAAARVALSRSAHESLCLGGRGGCGTGERRRLVYSTHTG